MPAAPCVATFTQPVGGGAAAAAVATNWATHDSSFDTDVDADITCRRPWSLRLAHMPKSVRLYGNT